MHAILLGAIYAIGLVFLLLTFVIVLNKGVREARDHRRRARQLALEPRVLRYAHGDAASIVEALGGYVRRADRAVIEEILLSHLEHVKGIEAERLRGALDQMGFVDAYLAQLDGARWWTRARAAERLGLAGAVRATRKLAAALADESDEVRIRAARSLGLVGGGAAIQPLIQALREHSRWSSIRIADILAGMGPRVVDDLVEEFPGLPLHARISVIDILARIRTPHVAPWLRARLEDEEADVRARTCHALGVLGDLDAKAALRSALRDRAWPVRAMAAKALGRLRHAEAIPDLCDLLRDREWWVRSNSAEALRQMGPTGIEALLRMLNDRDLFACHQAVLKLEETGTLDQQVALLSAEDGSVRAAGESVVRRFIEAGQIGRLLELSAGHRDGSVRQRLKQLLERGATRFETAR